LQAPARPKQAPPDLISIDPVPLYPISPHLSMQFMEALGATDSAVAAAWDDDADAWRQDFVEVVRDLAPGAIRWGGLMSRYYRWREGVGPAHSRRPMRNYQWGGWETNRVGTAELVALCRQVRADPIFAVNFLSDGHVRFRHMSSGDRTADAREAADWVSYCNDPDDRARRGHGQQAPFDVKLWQLGNETSYGDNGFSKSEAIGHTASFARAMRARDPSIKVIGWGDRGRTDDPSLWARDMLRQAGEHLDYLAMHMMQQLPTRPDTVLRGRHYQDAPRQAWAELMDIAVGTEERLAEMESVIAAESPGTAIAVTEGHLSLTPHNTNPILEEWLSGAYHARMLNMYQRHGRTLRIATAADFMGTRWSVVAVRLPVPGGRSYLMPVGSVMRLFQRHNGDSAVSVAAAPSDLDIAASRSGDTIFLHVANLSDENAIIGTISVDGRRVVGGRVLEIAPDRLRQAVTPEEPDVFAPVETPLPVLPSPQWRFPAASVSVIELRLQAA
jgi:alpha-L-arabinofuranosidase